MKAHLPLDMDILELEYLIITMAMSNGKRMGQKGQAQWKWRALMTNCACTENDVSNGQKNGRFHRLVTVHSMTDFQGLVIMMTYVHTTLSIFLCTYNDMYSQTRS